MSENKPKAAKEDKSAKNKKSRSRFAVTKYFRDFKGEFKKIIWPTRQTVVRNTAVTLAMCALIGLFVSLFDFGLAALINLTLQL